jgi:photosystem II stability/assembly factor-like uncharacterized protein
MSVGNGSTEPVPLAFQSLNGARTWTAIPSPPGATSLTTVSCQPTGTCLVEGTANHDTGFPETIIWSTADGGTTWSSHDLGQGPEYDLKCQSPTRCFAVAPGPGPAFGNSVLEQSTDGGTTWHAFNPATPDAINDFACPSAAVCYVATRTGLGVGGTLQKTTDGGATWKVVMSGHTDSVTCPSSSVCLVTQGHNLFRTVDAGGTWSAVDLPSGTSLLGFPSCPDATNCSAVVEGASHTSYSARTSDGGSTWTLTMIGSLDQQSGSGLLDCPTDSTCFLAGFGSAYGAISVSTGGAAWQPYAVGRGRPSLQAVACAEIRCVAVGGGYALFSLDAGHQWTHGGPLPPADSFTSIACPSLVLCIAVGSSRRTNLPIAFRTRDMGRSWQPLRVPSVFWPRFTSIACSDGSTCTIAVSGALPQLMVTTDGGSRWSYAKTPTLETMDAINAVSCTGRRCVALGRLFGTGTDALVSHDGGRTWTYSHSVVIASQGNGVVDTVSCASTRDCLAAGGAAYRTVDGGIRWHWTGVSLPVPEISNVACVLAVCQAVGIPPWGEVPSLLLRSSDLGGHWSNESLPAGAFDFRAVARTSSDIWVAVGADMAGGPLVLRLG